MTQEELKAIRERVDAANGMPRGMARVNLCCKVVARDTPALLDEVERLRGALKEINSYRPEQERVPESFHVDVKACPECQRRERAKWPPSGLCEHHYRIMSVVTRKNEIKSSNQHIHMREIARRALGGD